VAAARLDERLRAAAPHRQVVEHDATYAASERVKISLPAAGFSGLRFGISTSNGLLPRPLPNAGRDVSARFGWTHFVRVFETGQ
jgi:hypothetical protein